MFFALFMCNHSDKCAGVSSVRSWYCVTPSYVLSEARTAMQSSEEEER